MELQSFISDNSDYIEKLKNDGFKTKRFGRYNLLCWLAINRPMCVLLPITSIITG